MVTLIEYARYYVSKGFSVIPIKPKDKKPLLLSWKEYQTRKPTDAELSAWFKHEDTNIAIITGAISGLVVVDLDSDKAVQWAEKNGLMNTPTQKTGKGYHLFFKYLNGIQNTQKRPDTPDVDIRGEGGYVVVSPSTHRSGHKYQWVEGKTLEDLDLAEFPEILLKQRQKTFREVMKGVNEGNRNDTLARLTGSNILRGLSYDECLDFAYAWNEKNNPPLPLEEVKKTVESIYDRHIHQKNSNYFINSDGYLCKYKMTKDGLIPYPLCNFDARIKSDIVIDDGANTERYFEIIGKRKNKSLPAVKIKTSQFASLSWVTDNWGNDAIIETVQTAKDNIRYYIQTASTDIDRRVI